MANPFPTADVPAASPYSHTQTTAGSAWFAPPDQRTLERERLEQRARGTDATAQLIHCFPALESGARAADLAGTRAARR
jgi:hypothetical protein